MTFISPAFTIISSHVVVLSDQIHYAVVDRADVVFSWREFGVLLDEVSIAIMMPIELNF
jgi:hypothetical protein